MTAPKKSTRRRRVAPDDIRHDPKDPIWPAPPGCKYIQIGGHTKRSAGKEQWAIVDERDYDALSKHKWSLHEGGYAYRSEYDAEGVHRPVRMHQQIKRYPSKQGKVVDHINGCRLDNRRANLRAISQEHNSQNRLPQTGGTSRFRGVSYLGPHRWRATMRNRYLGTFSTEIEAAIVADQARVKMMPGATPCRLVADEIAERELHEFDLPA